MADDPGIWSNQRPGAAGRAGLRPWRSCLAVSGALALAPGLTSCLPLEPPARTAALESRVAALEEKLAETRRQQETAALASRLTDLEQRIDEAEQSRGKDRAGMLARDQEVQAQLQWLRRLYDVLDDVVISGERAVGLSLAEQNLIPCLTRYGSFLFKLAGCDKAKEGYDLQLLVTNATPFRIHRFRLHGDFGRKSPVLPASATTRQRIETLDTWELNLAKFDQSFDTVLEPAERTPLVLHLPASRLADLEFIRLWIEIGAVTLPPARPAGTYAAFNASRPDPNTLHVLPSDAGTFYLKLEKIAPAGTGQQLTLRFGNPLGMTIDKLRLHGTLGRKPPPPAAADPPEKRERAQLEWQQSRRAFSREVRATVKPMQWTQFTLDLPAPTPADLEYVECRVDALEVHLLPGK